jgi:hypothetical protein
LRWRFVDRVDSFEPWRAISGRKGVSLEEYCLPDPLGRRGALPESLVAECCVELARWLVAASSDFELTARLEALEGLEFEREARTGSALEVGVEVLAVDGEVLRAGCTVADAGGRVAAGKLAMRTLPTAEGFDAELVASMWRELNGQA